MAIRYDADQRKVFVEEYRQSGMALSTYQAKKKEELGDGFPSLPSLTKWVKEQDAKDKAEAEAKASTGNAPGQDSALYDAFKESLLAEDLKDKYIAFLEKRVRELEAELEAKEG